MAINRRQFIAGAVAGAGSLVLGGRAGAAPEAAAALPTDPYHMVTLGKSGVKTTFIGMGTGAHAGMRDSDLKRAGKEYFLNTIRYAWDKGIRFFDCADTYGSHEWISEALADKPRDSYHLVSKIWFNPGKGQLPETERPDADITIARFLKEIKTDYIDVLQMHCMVNPGWGGLLARQMEILQKIKDKGMIRSHGVSVHNLDALRACVKDEWTDVVHTRVNAFGASMDGPPEVVLPVVKDIHGSGKGVIGMKLVGNGKFAGEPEKIDQSLKYVLDQECVDAIIVGFTKPEQIDDFEARTRKALEARAQAAKETAMLQNPTLIWGC